MKKIEVKASKTYPVFIDSNLIGDAGKFIKETVSPLPAKVALFCDDKVESLYAAAVEKSLKDNGFETYKFIFKNGEAQKHMGTIVQMIEFLAQNDFTRKDLAVALGGGVTGDMTGFSAAIYKRGIRFVQIPTTLLAMVDSSVGGKTGCNLSTGKNLAGAFYQPELVICDTDCLKTLDDKDFACGLAEAIKTAVIRDAKLFEIFKKRITKNDSETLKKIIARCVEIKADVVAQDEKEGGLRQILNFGHTIGHAIEKLSDYKIPHGEAVSIGMATITKAFAKTGKAAPALYEELTAVLEANNLPVKHAYSAQSVYSAALSDKKRNAADSITAVCAPELGKTGLLPMKLKDFENLVSASF
ncbi:MAG: 3-dehydroquinate synthase [Spirochaetaceae bacterium]|nr:3-dehydroquinate synthase [Spirochaetaceae bacterium]